MSIHSSATIHPTAIIEEGAVIGENVFVGPFCLVSGAVVIKKNTHLKSHVVVSGDTEIGSDNEIYPFVTIGEVNQDLKYKGENTKTLIGNHNRIRESVTIHRGSVQGGGITQIGNDNLLMVGAHIAHDCIVGNFNIFANNATLGGHVHIANQVIVGGLTAIHQFCTVGDHVMIGGCSGVVKDIPPYCVAQGNHAKPFGINKIGLKRHGFSQEQIMAIYECYKILYRSDFSLEQAQEAIAKLAESHEELAVYPAFFAQSTRGIIR